MVTVRPDSDLPPESNPALRTAVILVVSAVGLGLNLRAWILLGPHLHARFTVGSAQYVLLMGLPLLVAALARLPVGVLTDRYGARVMFPAVTLAGAVAVVALGMADTLPLAVVAGTACGVSGSAFVVGTAMLSRTFPYGRRGMALGVFTLGTGVTVGVSAASRGADPGGQRAALVLAVLLVAIAALAAAVFRDPVRPRPNGSTLRRSIDMVVVASTTSLSVLYGLALGGLAAAAVYLPVYLSAVFRLEWSDALVVTGVVVLVAGVARLGGGWWADRRPTARLLTVSYAVAAALCLAVALEPRWWWLAALTVGAAAVCDGVAGGALLALIGKASRPDNAGAVMGVTGAVAALGSLVPPLLLIGINMLAHTYSAAWILLAAAFLGVAQYVRAHGLRIGLGLSVRAQGESGPTSMTVAVVGESDTHLGAAAVVGRLADLASTDELVVLYGSDDPSRPRLSANVLVSGLRERLPRHSVVALRVAPRTGGLDQTAAVLDEFLETGTVTIAVTSTLDLRGVAAQLAAYLRADRVLVVRYSPATGADLHEVWRRPAESD
jgi:NNP family nitrate/nitrite transporter-like MFS transporter